jgi:hypothetical protein
MLFVLPILVLLIATTRKRGQGPSPAPKRRREAEAAAPKRLFATDVFTRHTHVFSGPGAYADCRNMMNRVTFVLPPGQRKPSDAWPGHFGIFSTNITEKQRLFECAGCGVEVWSHLCRVVPHEEHMEQLREAKRRAAELGFCDTPVQRLACTTCYQDMGAPDQPEPADNAEEPAENLVADELVADRGATDGDAIDTTTLQQQHATLQQDHAALQQEHAALLQQRSGSDPAGSPTPPIDRAPPEPDTGSLLADWNTADGGIPQVVWMTGHLNLENPDDLENLDWPGLDWTG